MVRERKVDLMKRRILYPWLLLINLFISTFTFGGGYVVVPMIRKYFVEKKNLFTEEELMEMAAVAQSSPGAIAINLSALSGYRVGGIPGVAVSCVAAVIPPLVILSAISVWYTAFSSNPVIAGVLEGMEAGVAALIVDLVADMCQMIIRERSKLLTAMIPVAFFANYVLGINVALILVVCCCVCAGKIWLENEKKRREEASC